MLLVRNVNDDAARLEQLNTRTDLGNQRSLPMDLSTFFSKKCDDSRQCRHHWAGGHFHARRDGLHADLPR